MSPTDPTTLLRELRPEAEARPDEDALERLLLAGPQTLPRRHARYVRPVALAGTIAVVATAGVAVLPGDGGSVPGILDRAAAAVTKPDTILHYRSTVTSGSGVRTVESWQTTDGRRNRTIFQGGELESVRDEDARTFVTYDRERDELLRHTDPAFFPRDGRAVPDLATTPPGLGVTQIGDLAELLRRAKDGADGVEVLEPTEIRGTPVEHVRITSSLKTFTGASGPGKGLDAPATERTTTRDIYLRTDDALPVRVVDRLGAPSPLLTIDFDVAESLPRDAATNRLLRMGPHPGASVRDEGTFR
ncbi:hypothetical protein [Patulibacter minatonensis]|uniref:hypothetical protein n=1 Tax=Patulibacter minatonensis TaxID=298163 RepID=UPI00047902DB|nr:hypothetical protein [Patulibacter minatonensis]